MIIFYGFLVSFVFLGLNYCAHGYGHGHGHVYDGMKHCICEPGPPGPVGRDGIKGYKGYKGAQGLIGDKGSIGPVGPQGFTGQPGIRGDDGSNIGPPGFPGPPGFDTECPPECRRPLRNFYKRSLTNFEPYTIYKVSAEGEMVAVKKLKPTPALRSMLEYLKNENFKQQNNEEDEC